MPRMGIQLPARPLWESGLIYGLAVRLPGNIRSPGTESLLPLSIVTRYTLYSAIVLPGT